MNQKGFTDRECFGDTTYKQVASLLKRLTNTNTRFNSMGRTLGRLTVGGLQQVFAMLQMGAGQFWGKKAGRYIHWENSAPQKMEERGPGEEASQDGSEG